MQKGKESREKDVDGKEVRCPQGHGRSRVAVVSPIARVVAVTARRPLPLPTKGTHGTGSGSGRRGANTTASPVDPSSVHGGGGGQGCASGGIL